MKTLSKIKLDQVGYESLSNREMKEVLGGLTCNCGCRYANSGGSSTNDNCTANYQGPTGSGLSSPGYVPGSGGGAVGTGHPVK